MLSIIDTVKSYNGNIVVNIPQLDIPTGEIIGLVGNNGAGKTTLFRLLLDLIRADKGEILSKEKNVAVSEDWKGYTAAYLDEGFLINYLTPEEYFYFIGKLHQRSKADVDEFLQNFEAFFDGSILNSGKYIRDLSKGNQFKVGIAACLLQQPELLTLDEPFANLDPSSQLRLIRMLKELPAQQRVTVLISSHDLNHVTEVCHRILLMEKGRIIKDIDTTADTLQELESYFEV
ncbi:ABC transporter ATP-binding protein [Flavitalea sp. BT771]|uniref:ABC transporter ATP-binding protein n=1 Tax=Flavitalea sp. BT771 TaxID=3063329 RepID=UPI0026E2EA9F|nr:ABC transporter ATP-binding protein [Flavitalea sp. BT771]MDO6434943.1 ABC transporter ATP-binding protein [Flavitalea sp. BT771]MDV6223843.1 ABC transporter ATP-binding protein [Flavitalea sp. BT771]